MRVAFCSDLHLDVGPNPINPEFWEVDADVMILAGDIVEGKDAKHYHDFWSRVASTWKKVFYVLGNHEFYRGAIPKSEIDLYSELNQYGFTFLQNEAEEFNGVRFIGSTLWTDMKSGDPLIEMAVQSYMNDFKGAIRLSNNGFRKFLPRDAHQLHRKARAYIGNKLKEASTPTVVITHHAPSFMSISSRFANSWRENHGYASDLSELMLDNPHLKFWIHGHTHSKFDYQIGECRVLCNPRGYDGERPDKLKPYQPEVIGVN